MIFGVILRLGRGQNGGCGQTHPQVKFEVVLGEGMFIFYDLRFDMTFCSPVMFWGDNFNFVHWGKSLHPGRNA